MPAGTHIARRTPLRLMAVAAALVATLAAVSGVAHAYPYSEPRPCYSCPRVKDGSPFGHLDDAGWGGSGWYFYAKGWAIDPDTTSAVWISITFDGRYHDAVLANRYRPDVGAAYPGYGDYHGFDFTLPYSEVPYGTGQICLTAVNAAGFGSDTPLGCWNPVWLN